MARRSANRLFVEEIDEVSSVDRPANQLGLIAIAKRAGEQTMGEYFDADGNEVDIDSVQVGQQVFDEAGAPFVMLGDDDIQELINSGQLTEDQIVDLDEDDGQDDDVFDDDRELVGSVGKRQSLGATLARGRGAPGVTGGARTVRSVGGGRGRDRLGEPNGRRIRKSAGQQILENLRKAMTDADRDDIIAKAFDGLDAANERVNALTQLVEDMVAEREGERYLDIAKNYDAVPVETGTLASILAKASTVLSKRELDAFGQLLEVASNPALFEEQGYNGVTSGSDVLDQVQAYAQQVVGKSGDLTEAQAISEIFSANPAAYDEYELEHGRR